MKNQRKAFLYFIVIGLLPFCITTADSALTSKQIAKKALAATVYLETMDSNDQTLGFGSGFFVGPNQIVTNFHVIEGATKGTAKLVNKSMVHSLEDIIATDKENDLALLKIAAFGVEPLPLGDSDTVEIGEEVYVAGNPKGLEGTFSNGIISSLREGYTQKRLQMTAPISPGSSGGPVLNRKGEVIGVSFMTIQGGQNLNFAIPSNYLKELLARSGTAKPFPQSEQSISAVTHFNRGNMMYSLERYNMAIVEYNKAIRLKPDFYTAYGNRGAAKLEFGRYEEAIVDYDQAIRLKPDFYIAYNNRASIKSRLGRYEEAIADCDQAIRLKPDFHGAYYNRGAAKSRLGRYEEAIADFDQAIRLKPDFDLGYGYRGITKFLLGRYEEAIVDYDQAIKLDPDDAMAYNNRANAKFRLGRYEEAIADCDQAIRLNPDFALAHNNRADAKLKLGRYEEAIADCDQAIQLAPDFAAAYYKRGSAKLGLGHKQGADQDLQTALKLAEQFGDKALKAKTEELLKRVD